MSSVNISKNNRQSMTPRWQIERMKTMIAERWQDVWETASIRESYRRELDFLYYVD
jgi:hypothetical protein